MSDLEMKDVSGQSMTPRSEALIEAYLDEPDEIAFTNLSEGIRQLESSLAEAVAALREIEPVLLRAGFILKSDSALRLKLCERVRKIIDS